METISINFLMSVLAVLIVLMGRITIVQNQNLNDLYPESPLIKPIIKLIKYVGIIFYISFFIEVFLILQYLITV
jgi:hypothetical protein